MQSTLRPRISLVVFSLCKGPVTSVDKYKARKLLSVTALALEDGERKVSAHVMQPHRIFL